MVNILAAERAIPAPTQAAPLPPPSRQRFGRDRQNAPPQFDGKRVTLSDQRNLFMRPIAPGDAPALQRCFSRLGPDEVRMRFMLAMRELPEATARRMCDIDPEREAAFVLMDKSTSPAELRGAGRIYIDPATRSAEFALLVERAWTGQGLGLLLMQQLIAECRRRKLDQLWGHVLVDNRPMLELCRDLGFRHQPAHDDPGLQYMSLSLD
jgi:acetyltransferase